MRCERCGVETRAHIMSYFNTDTICLDCSKTERAHPRFDEAVEAECAAIRQGDFNYPGIGLPDDLKGGGR